LDLLLLWPREGVGEKRRRRSVKMTAREGDAEENEGQVEEGRVEEEPIMLGRK
jgi:hypothetical protein